MSDYVISSPAGQRMLEALPDLYEEVYETRVLMAIEGKEIDDLTTNIADAFDQAYVDRATWGLAHWETVLGIQTDAAKPYDQRRSVIKSKIRGTGTVTLTLLKRVAEAYDNGTVEVTQQAALYQFTVRFVGTLGLPPNIDDLKASIESIKPAHLDVVYSFRYLSMSEIHNVMAIDQIQSRPLTDFAPFLEL